MKAVNLGDICNIIGGGTPSKSNDAFFNGNIPWATVRDMRSEVLDNTEHKITSEAVEKSSTNIIPKGNVIIATRVGLGKVCFLNQDTAINQDLRGVLPKNNNQLDVRFLFWWLQSVSNLIVKAGTGATVQGVKLPFVKGLQIPLFSISEQKRIVAILDEAFAGIDQAIANTEKNLASAHELFESTSRSLISNVPGVTKITLLEMLEKGWILSHLDGNHGGNYPRKSEFIEEGIPYISANCLKKGDVDFENAKYLSPEKAATLRKGIAQNRDVLFAHNATVGPTALLKTSENKVILGTSLTYYRCNEQNIIPEYLLHYLKSPEFTKQYKLVMGQSTRNQVPITKQREFYHLIPPLDKQKEIAERLDQLSIEVKSLDDAYQKKLAALNELKQSLLQKAFSGKLTADIAEDMAEAAE